MVADDTDLTDTDPAVCDSPIHRILVVDDSRAQRRLLSSSLVRQGYEVIEAATGLEALEICKTKNFDLILSDWMMPGMDGLEFCVAFRELPQDGYVYFILLTSKTEKGAVAQGLDVGADDFLAKPVNPDELRSRINAGGRLLSMERELQHKNRLVSKTLDEIQTLYDSLDRDLVEARKMQQSLVREKYRDCGNTEVALMLQPCGHVGGDLVGFFDAGEQSLGFYSIDVSGHGIASALLTARLASYFSDGSPAHNIALEILPNGNFQGRSPAVVAEELNDLLLNDIRSEHYFTMLLGYIDQSTGEVVMSQCGHPNAVLLPSQGLPRFVGDGGMPIGLIPGADFDTQSLTLLPGERLMFYSDGFTECADKSGALLDEEGFAKIIDKNRNATNEALFEAMIWDLDVYSGGQDLDDDLSCVMVTYKPEST
jgi:sigma-B regulation protein RsbU (phosphoserine phosphatase)